MERLEQCCESKSIAGPKACRRTEIMSQDRKHVAGQKACRGTESMSQDKKHVADSLGQDHVMRLSKLLAELTLGGCHFRVSLLKVKVYYVVWLGGPNTCIYEVVTI